MKIEVREGSEQLDMVIAIKCGLQCINMLCARPKLDKSLLRNHIDKFTFFARSIAAIVLSNSRSRRIDFDPIELATGRGAGIPSWL